MPKPRLFLKRYGPSKPRGPKNSLSLDPSTSLTVEGAGVFETLRAYGGKIFALDMHLERFHESAQSFGFAPSFDGAPGRMTGCASGHLNHIGLWVKSALYETGYKNAYLRLMAVFQPEKLLILMVKKFQPPGPRFYEGVKIRTASTRKNFVRSQDPGIKSNQYASAVQSFIEEPGFLAPRPRHKARRAHAGAWEETLFLNKDGFLTEGRISNFFIVKGTALFTPHPACGILRGVTRHFVLEAARRAGLLVHETHLGRHDLYNADEAFLTTTLSEVVPVTQADGRRVGKGRKGPWTKRIHQHFRELVRETLVKETGF